MTISRLTGGARPGFGAVQATRGLAIDEKPSEKELGDRLDDLIRGEAVREIPGDESPEDEGPEEHAHDQAGHSVGIEFPETPGLDAFFDEALDPLPTFGQFSAKHAGDLRIEDGFPEHHPGDILDPSEHLDPVAKQGSQQFTVVKPLRPLEDGEDGRDRMALEELEQDIALAGEVDVDRPFRHSGGLGDLSGRGPFEALPGEQLDRGGNDLPAFVDGVAGADSCGFRWFHGRLQGLRSGP